MAVPKSFIAFHSLWLGRSLSLKQSLRAGGCDAVFGQVWVNALSGIKDVSPHPLYMDFVRVRREGGGGSREKIGVQSPEESEM